MRVTRSTTTSTLLPSLKRTAQPLPTPRKRAKTAPAPTAVVADEAQEEEDPAVAAEEVKESLAAAEKEGVLLHPALTFKYADARTHLESVDPRWGHMMDKLRCKPFEGKQTTVFEPFRSLASSIIAQQVSWLAARSIQHKFVRLFYPHLPEKLAKRVPDAKKDKDDEETEEEEASPFPTPAQILALPNPVPTLRSAGLSGRKVEYVMELAERFHDGRIEAVKLWEMDDEEVKKTLLEVRGIGIWTVQMFLIFSMKRPDVLPVGDLGIQKNLCKWYSADPSLVPSIHPRKLVRAETPPPTTAASTEIPSTPEPSENAAEITAYPTPSTPSTMAPFEAVRVPSVPAAAMVFPPTSNNLTPSLMKARLNKKLKGNIYLSPTEMEELTAVWAPYRSVACWYLWQIRDGA